MAVPRNRLSNARKNIRRSHHAKKPSNVLECSNCKKAVISHRVCNHCGFYDGRSTIKGAEKD